MCTLTDEQIGKLEMVRDIRWSKDNASIIWKILVVVGNENLYIWWAGLATWEEIGLICYVLGHRMTNFEPSGYCSRCGKPNIVPVKGLYLKYWLALLLAKMRLHRLVNWLMIYV